MDVAKACVDANVFLEAGDLAMQPALEHVSHQWGCRLEISTSTLWT